MTIEVYTKLPHADLELSNGDLILLDRQGRWLKRWIASSDTIITSPIATNDIATVLTRRWFQLPSLMITQGVLHVCEKIDREWPKDMIYSRSIDERCHAMIEQSIVTSNRRAYQAAHEVLAKRRKQQTKPKTKAKDKTTVSTDKQLQLQREVKVIDKGWDRLGVDEDLSYLMDGSVDG